MKRHYLVGLVGLALGFALSSLPAAAQAGLCGAGKPCTAPSFRAAPAAQLAHTATYWDAGFTLPCNATSKGTIVFFAGAAVQSDGGGVNLDAGTYLCDGRWKRHSTEAASSSSSISILAVADGGTGQASLGAVKVGAAFMADASVTAQAFDHTPTQCGVGSLAAGIDSTGAAQCYGSSIWVDAGGELCVGPGGGIGGLCWAGAYTAPVVDAGRVLSAAGSTAAPAYSFGTCGACGMYESGGYTEVSGTQGTKVRAASGAAYVLVTPNTATISATSLNLVATPVTSTGIAQLGDGTLAAPTYGFSAASNAGMWRTSGGRVAFANGGSRQFEIGSSSWIYGYTDNFALSLGEANVTKIVAGNASLWGYVNGRWLLTSDVGLQSAGVAHASLTAAATALAGTENYCTTHQRMAFTDGGAWYHSAHIEDFAARDLHPSAQFFAQGGGGGFNVATLVPGFLNHSAQSAFAHGVTCSFGTKGNTAAWCAANLYKVSGGALTDLLGTCAPLMCDGDAGAGFGGLFNHGSCDFGSEVEVGAATQVALQADCSACTDIDPDTIYCNVD